MTEKQIEHMQRAYRRILRGFETVQSYWRQNMQDNELTVIMNTLDEALREMLSYMESNAKSITVEQSITVEHISKADRNKDTGENE